MKVLWITNLPLPTAQEYLFHTLQPKEGWLVQLSQRLAAMPNIDLIVASRTLQLREEQDFIRGGIHHYCFPGTWDNDDKQMVAYWHRVYAEVKPDIVHIQGTECPHSLFFITACPSANIVVSIQGMTSVISTPYYYFGGISIRELTKLTTFYNRFMGNTIAKRYSNMTKAGERERFILRHAKYVLGRTEWDRVHAETINPSIQYFTVNETMRSLFYKNKWSKEYCIPYTIFMTQGMAPYKGLHKMLAALSIIKKTYPNVKLRIAIAPNLLKPLSWKEKLIAGEYQTYLRNMVKKQELMDNIEILGPLSEKGMVDAMLTSNVFVSPSTIENSPNSLCEAQLLGMPTLASYVGGTPTIAADGAATELYRYEEVEMLAAKVMRIFKEGPDMERITYAQALALRRNDPLNNVKELIKIYQTIL